MTGTKSFRAERITEAALRVFIAVLLISPFLIWISRLNEWSWPAIQEWWRPLKMATAQATLSTLCSFAAGFALFRGLAAARAERRFWAESALLLPNLFPPLFVALSLMSWAPFIGGFPFGLGAVILAHVILNSGLAALAMDRLYQDRLAGLAEAAATLGVSTRNFLRFTAWPVVKGDLLVLSLFLFSMHFTSFSLPLLLGGDQALSLEVSIFDAIRVDGRWDKALLLSALQSAILFLLACAVAKPQWRLKGRRDHLFYAASPVLRGLVFVPAGVLFGGWLLGGATSSVSGWEPAMGTLLMNGGITSLGLGLIVGLLHVLLFLTIGFVLPHRSFERFLNSYLAPSPAITGFAMLMLPVDGEIARIFVCAFALTLISAPLLYRWLVHSAFTDLQGQVTVAQTLGASKGAILFEVLWPQAAGPILRAAGLGALWASGDFALSGILLGPNATLPLVIDDLLGHYRLESATVLLLPLAGIGLALYGFFTGVRRYVVG